MKDHKRQTFCNSAIVTRIKPGGVPLRSFPEDVNLAQSSAEQPGAKATFPLFLTFFSSFFSLWIPKEGFLVVLGGGAISPIGVASGRIAMFRSEGCSISLGGEGGARENEGAG